MLPPSKVGRVMPKTLVSNRITSILSHYLSVHFYTIIFDTSPEEEMKLRRNSFTAKNNKSSSLIPRGKKIANNHYRFIMAKENRNHSFTMAKKTNNYH